MLNFFAPVCADISDEVCHMRALNKEFEAKQHFEFHVWVTSVPKERKEEKKTEKLPPMVSGARDTKRARATPGVSSASPVCAAFCVAAKRWAAIGSCSRPCCPPPRISP